MTTSRPKPPAMALAALGLLALVLSSLVLASAKDEDEGEGEGRLPAFSEGALPKPPAQEGPWTPPETRLPRFLIPATETLFAQGLADPRGCDYRVIELATGGDPQNSFPGAEEPGPLHGWVIPAEGGEEDGPRFAVGWNGLVYPLDRIGEPADLEADIRAVVASREDQPPGRGWFGWQVAGHRRSVDQGNATPTNVCMLLRLGRADLAEALFASMTDWTGDRPVLDLKDHRVSYLSLAHDWAWTLFDRAVTSHALGFDALALADLRSLAVARERIEAHAEAMGFPRPSQSRQDGSPYIDFLGPLDGLLADQERREREGPRPSLDEISRIEDRPERIAALIRALDEVGLQPSMISNGFASYFASNDPTVRALIAEGFDAIEPLADALEADDRLTRTVDRSSRSPSRTLSIMPVRQVVYDTVVAILGTRNFGEVVRYARLDSPTPEERRRLADSVRDYARRFADLSDEERWYQLLRDDRATSAQRHEAADQLVRLRADRERDGGAPVLADAEPTVSALIAQRIRELDRVDFRERPDGTAELTPGVGLPEQVVSANQLARLLLRWDSEAALPLLVERSARCGQMLRGNSQSQNRERQITTDFAWLTLTRVDLGDEAALDEFAGVMAALSPDQLDDFPIPLFEPIWTHAGHPSILALADRMYGDPESPWLPLANPEDGFWSGRGPGRLVPSPMLGVGPFRARVLEALGDQTPVGSVHVDDLGGIEIRLTNTTSRPDPLEDDPLRPEPGTRMDLRMADVIAGVLAGVGGIPTFEYWWPEPRRDEAIETARAFLERFGDRFRFSEWHQSADPMSSSYSGVSTASAAFEPLDRPATDEDLARGLALFSLEGRGERRVVPLPERPLRARWLTLTDTPQIFQRQDPETGESIQEVRYLQDGWVWQAEEVFEEGRWRRFYGFLGWSSYGKAPAEEVEFPEPGEAGWHALTDALDVRIMPPGSRIVGNHLFSPPADPDGPLRVEVSVRNRAGLERRGPSPIGPIAEDDAPGLREGVSVSLSRAPLPGPKTRGFPEEHEFLPIASREAPRVPGEADGPMLAPGESARLLSIDLRSVFEIDGPGFYRLEIGFDDLIGPDGGPARVLTSFRVQAPESGPAAGL